MINKYIDENVANNIISILLQYCTYVTKAHGIGSVCTLTYPVVNCVHPYLAIYDVLPNTKKNCIIETVNLGLCAGMGAILCSSGTKGYRSAMPNSSFLLQQIGQCLSSLSHRHCSLGKECQIVK